MSFDVYDVFIVAFDTTATLISFGMLYAFAIDKQEMQDIALTILAGAVFFFVVIITGVFLPVFQQKYISTKNIYISLAIFDLLLLYQFSQLPEKSRGTKIIMGTLIVMIPWNVLLAIFDGGYSSSAK